VFFNLISCLFLFCRDCGIIDSARFNGLCIVCEGKEGMGFCKMKGFLRVFDAACYRLESFEALCGTLTLYALFIYCFIRL